MNDNASRHSDSSGFRRDGSRSQGRQEAGNAAFGATLRLQLNRTPHGPVPHCHHEQHRDPKGNHEEERNLSECCPTLWSCIPFMHLRILCSHERKSMCAALRMCWQLRLRLQPLPQAHASKMCQALSMMWRHPHWTISADGAPAWGPSCGRWSGPRSTSILLSGAHQQLLRSGRAP